MWGLVLVSLLIRITEVYGQNVLESKQMENKTDDGLKTNVKDLREKLNGVKIIKFGSLLDSSADWASVSAEKIEKSRTHTALQATENGRRLKNKKTQLAFLMKLLLILKVVLGLILPLGIIASKILSWKAVTLSLMALMLAKILFIKNLLTDKNTHSVTPANFVSPFLIHGASNDVFWKRQGDVQKIYPWSSP